MFSWLVGLAIQVDFAWTSGCYHIGSRRIHSGRRATVLLLVYVFRCAGVPDWRRIFNYWSIIGPGGVMFLVFLRRKAHPDWRSLLSWWSYQYGNSTWVFCRFYTVNGIIRPNNHVRLSVCRHLGALLCTDECSLIPRWILFSFGTWNEHIL